MKCFHGKSVFGGIAIGKIRVYQKDRHRITCSKTENPEAEIVRYQEAKSVGIRQLQDLYDKALKEVGQESADIFAAHEMMLGDDDYSGMVKNIIRSQGVCAEYAVALAGEEFARMFTGMEDEYMREREADVRDISQRLIGILDGDLQSSMEISEPVIVTAEDLTPSETLQLDKDMVLSFVTTQGSLHSHTAILARTRGIPALVGTAPALDDSIHGKLGIVDGTTGTLYVEPDEMTLAELTGRQQKEQEKKQQLLALKGQENVTLDGRKVMLYANIGELEDLNGAIQNDAGGIGLFRSEFIYLGKDCYPTEEEQFQIYRRAAEMMAGKPVIIRTLDLGADKQSDYVNMEREENPALGYRGIRIRLNHPEVFRTQLRALFRASAFGAIAILYPMVTSVEEVKQLKKLADQVKAELTDQGVRFGQPRQGIMIETPAAALISDLLAKEVDFFSIGTNDLTQYTLAADRRNTKLQELYDPHHPAILRLISMVVENAHKAGIPAGICGELGADPTLTREFLAMGVDELSVPSETLLSIRKIVRETDIAQYRMQNE